MLLLEHTCDIYRDQAVTGSHTRTSQQVATGVRCLALPMNVATAVTNGFDIGRAFDFYFDPGTDVRVKDRLERNGASYTVSAAQSYETVYGAHVHVTAQREVGE